MRGNSFYNSKIGSSSTAGFTLLESIIVVSMIGMLVAIAAPSWFGFLNRQRLNTAQNEIYRAMQEAKSNATRDKVTWQFSAQEVTVKGKTTVQWAVHRSDPVSPNHIPTNIIWNKLDPNVQVYKDKNDKGSCETTFNKKTSNCPQGPWRVQFNYMGTTSNLGQLTLTTKNGGKIKRCVYVSTLLGTLRTGKEHRNVNKPDKKYCY